MKNMLPNNLEAVFLDFDGVVLDSADIKTHAFYELYQPYGSVIAEKARDYHLMHQGISRYKKFVEIHKNYLNKECSEDDLDYLSNRFSEIVFQKIIKCDFIEGVVDFLAKMSAINIPVFLLSATPHDELLDICNQRQITKFFTKIYGSPHDKKRTGINLIAENNFNADNILFVGDSLSDFNAAAGIGTKFCGRVAKDSTSPFNPEVNIIQSFKEVL